MRIKDIAFIYVMIVVYLLAIVSAFGQAQDSLTITTKIKNPCVADTVKVMWIGGTVKIPVNVPCPDTLFRGIYVNAWSSIIGNKSKEDALIADLNKYRANHISIYSISSTTNASLTTALFVRIRLETKVKTICPAISSSGGIDNWKSWNNSHSPDQDVDGVTLEYEAYNQSNVATAWGNNILYLQQMDAGVKSGIFKTFSDYFGWWKVEPMVTQTPDTLVKYFHVKLNNFFLHDYRTSPDWPYMKSRTGTLNASGIEQGKVIRIKILFSCEPDFLQNWLKAGHTVEEAFWIVYNAFKAEKYTNVIIDGYMVFHLDFLRASQPATAFMSVRSMVAAKPMFSENNFKNKTTRKGKRIMKYNMENGFPSMPPVSPDSIPLPVDDK